MAENYTSITSVTRMAGAALDPDSDDLIGRTVAGKYTVLSRVGGGGMGSVYRARQAGLGKTVAIKVLHRELLAEPTFASRFQREAMAASRIDHPNCMRVIDFGEEPDGLLYLAMEFLEGRTLFRVLRDEAPLVPARIIDLSRQILAVLAAAHDLGIVHRDLKPENVIVLPGKDDEGRPTEVVKVCDFGIAKLQVPRETDEKLTMEGSIVGTPEYLSPEQARGGELDARSDLYSMGVILFEMLTGQPPFHGDSPLATVLMHIDTPVPRPSSLTPQVDKNLEAVCLKALAKVPADRHDSAREMRGALSIDPADLAAPPSRVRPRNVLIVAETPPPFSSTPLPLISRSSSALAAVRGPGPSARSSRRAAGTGRVIVGAVLLAFLTVGAGAALVRRHAVASRRAPVQAVQPVAPPVPAPAPPPAAEPEPAAAAATPPSSSEAAGIPPSELPAAAGASAPHRRHAHGGASEAPAAEASSSQAAAAPAPAPAPPVAEVVAAPPAPTDVKVRVSNVHATGVEASLVTAAIPAGAFGRCYHGASGSHANVNIRASLHTGDVTANSAVSDLSLAGVGACIVDAVKRMRVKDIPAAGATADFDVDFDVP